MTVDQLDWVTSLAHSLSLVCDLTLLSPYVSFWPLQAPWHRLLWVPFQHRKQNRPKTSPKKKSKHTSVENLCSFSLSLSRAGCVQASLLLCLHRRLLSNRMWTCVSLLEARAGAFKSKLFFSWPLMSAWSQLWTLSRLCPRLVLFLVSLVVLFGLSFLEEEKVTGAVSFRIGKFFESYFWMLCEMVERRGRRHGQGGREVENLEDVWMKADEAACLKPL